MLQNLSQAQLPWNVDHHEDVQLWNWNLFVLHNAVGVVQRLD